VRADAYLGFAAPAEPGLPLVLTGIDVREVLLTWGETGLFAKGRVAVSDQGYAEGRIDLRITNWSRLLPALSAAGLIPPEALPTWERALTLLAGTSGEGAALDLPLSFRNGWASLGPVPIGPAPRLR
jgi:hypothetical protein